MREIIVLGCMFCYMCFVYPPLCRNVCSFFLEVVWGKAIRNAVRMPFACLRKAVRKALRKALALEATIATAGVEGVAAVADAFAKGFAKPL